MKIPADRISSIIFLLSACLYAPQLSGATVDSGSIHLVQPFSAGDFSLSGTGFTAAGGFEGGGWRVRDDCNFCEMGSSLRVDGAEVGDDFGGGPASVGGIAFDLVYWGYSLALGPTFFEVTGPPMLLNHGAGTYTSTFSFRGSLCGTVLPSADFRPPCTVNLTGLTGSGQVSVDLGLVSIPGRDVLFFKTATYTFDTVLAGVPEPSTIVLVASTAVMMFLGRRKIRGHKIL